MGESIMYSLLKPILLLFYGEVQVDNMILFGGVRHKDKVKRFVATPKNIIDSAVSRVCGGLLSYNDTVLEPSAGDGAIVEALTSGKNMCKVYAIEPNVKCKGSLVKDMYDCKFGSLVFWRNMRFEDFYKKRDLDTLFDYVFMHPPYEFQLDVAHTMMAFNLLKKGGTLYAICNEFSLYRPSLATLKFRYFLWRNMAEVSKINLNLCSYKVSSIEIIIRK
jgi:16S rRNA G966 N2-methylase RsmD